MLYDIVKEYDDAIGIATVYRTLQTFEDLNLVYKTNFDAIRITTNWQKIQTARHHHLICTNCENVRGARRFVGDLEHKIETEYNFEIHDHSVKFLGFVQNANRRINQ